MNKLNIMARVNIKFLEQKSNYVKQNLNFKYELRNFILPARGEKCGDIDKDDNLIITKRNNIESEI